MDKEAILFGKKSCLPPNPNTRKPFFKMPEKSCDTHCHVFGPHDQFPYHRNSTYHPPEAPKNKLFQLHNFLGIERGVIVQASCHGTDNTAMLDAISYNKKNYRGVCIADDSFSESDFKDLHDGGVRGVRFNFVTHLGGSPDLNTVLNVIKKIKTLNWHLVVHVNAEDIIKFENFFLKLDIEIIIDHMGRIPTSLGINQKAFSILKSFLKLENWWVKICGAERISSGGPPFYDAIPFGQELLYVAPERVLWGTDWPHPNIKKFMPNDGDLVDLVPLLTRDEELQKKILVDNPCRLYNF